MIMIPAPKGQHLLEKYLQTMNRGQLWSTTFCVPLRGPRLIKSLKRPSRQYTQQSEIPVPQISESMRHRFLGRLKVGACTTADNTTTSKIPARGLTEHNHKSE